MDYRLALMTGTDIPVPSCQLVIHQPTIKEIGIIGENAYHIGVQCLTLEKSAYVQDESLLLSTSNFQIFMAIMSERQEIEKKDSTMSVLQILFPKYKIMFTPRSLLFKNGEETIIIDEGNFEELQNVLRTLFCLSNDKQTFNPVGNEAKRIAEKLMKARQRVAAQKKAEEGDGSVFARLISSLAVGLHMPLDKLINLTVYQVYDLMERFSLWVNWDIDIRSRLMGGSSESKPENWMKNIH